MGFNSVYRTLQELFPQVDARLLKAAAIEHSNDPDGSVEFILTEVLPCTAEQFGTSSSTTRSHSGLSLVEKERHSIRGLTVSTCASSSDHASTSFAGEAANGSGEMNEPGHLDPVSLQKAVCGFSGSTHSTAKDIHDQLIGKTGEADAVSGEINVPCHVDPICLNGTTNGSLLLTLGDATDIGDQLSGSTGKVADGAGRMNKIFHVNTQCVNETVNSSDQTICDAMDMADHLSRNRMTEQLKASSVIVDEDATAVQDVPFQDISVPHTSEDMYNDDRIYNLPSENNGLKDTTASYRELDLRNASFSSLVSSAVLENDPISNSMKDSILVDDQNRHSSFGRGLLCDSNNVDLTSLSVEDHRLESFGSSIQSEVHSTMFALDDEISEYNGTTNVSFREDIQVLHSANIEESSSVDSVLTRSGQICRTTLLEDIIEDAKSHKKTLFSVMESVLKLTKEVELEEQIAQQTKEKALKRGFEVHAKVEELKKMLSRAREANDMHSGEVYGERAILSTEMRELQSRLLALSDEKDHSLSILNAMRQDLETRLAAAEEERMTAEKEICEKEESAHRALVEQELIMEKVVQESKMLQHEAEENTKLREFLVDRSHVVDMLQGEISVICEDVKLLKEKYDAKVPLSECLSLKQTSCILAPSASSASSSLKSTGSEQVVEQKSTGSEQVVEHTSPATASRPSSNKSFPLLPVEQFSESYQNESVEEGWELF